MAKDGIEPPTSLLSNMFTEHVHHFYSTLTCSPNMLGDHIRSEVAPLNFPISQSTQTHLIPTWRKKKTRFEKPEFSLTYQVPTSVLLRHLAFYIGKLKTFMKKLRL